MNSACWRISLKTTPRVCLQCRQLPWFPWHDWVSSIEWLLYQCSRDECNPYVRPILFYRFLSASCVLSIVINKRILYHIMELIIGAVFQVCLGATSSPEVPLLRRFQQFWEFVDQNKYETGMADDTVSRSVRDISDSTISVCKQISGRKSATGWPQRVAGAGGHLSGICTSESSLAHGTRGHASCSLAVESNLQLEDMDVSRPVPFDKDRGEGLARCLCVCSTCISEGLDYGSSSS